jgi:hypothetical protein
MALRLEQDGDDVLVWIKAVPGSSRDQIAGLVGDRLKIKVSAPAEGGRANKAICRALAAALGLKARQVTIEAGPASPEKVIRIAAAEAECIRRRFVQDSPASGT